MAEPQRDFGTEVKTFFSSTFGGLWGSITGGNPPAQPGAAKQPPPPGQAPARAGPPSSPGARTNPTQPTRGSTPDLGASRNTAAVRQSAPRSNSLTSVAPASPKPLEDGWMVLEEPENRPGSASPSSVPMVDEDDDEKTDDSPENVERFTAILDLLRACTWKYGCPVQFRPQVWRILLGILPPWPYLHQKLLDMKRQYYYDSAPKYLSRQDSNDDEKHLMAMIRSGFQNTGYRLRLFKNSTMLGIVCRVVYIFLQENNTLSYHDAFSQIPLVLLFAFLSGYAPAGTDFTKVLINDGTIAKEDIKHLEVDLYLALTALYENQGGLKDLFSSNPTSNIDLLQNLVTKTDPSLSQHLQSCDVQYLTFAYPWLESFFIDQILRMPVLVQMWDRYIASGRFVKYHVSLCAQNLPLHRIDPELMQIILDGASKLFLDANIVTVPTDTTGVDALIQKRKRRLVAQSEQQRLQQALTAK